MSSVKSGWGAAAILHQLALFVIVAAVCDLHFHWLPCLLAGAKHTVCHVLVLASSSDFYKKHYASPDSALSSSCVLLGMILTYDDASNGALPQHEGIALALVTTHLIAQWPAGS